VYYKFGLNLTRSELTIEVEWTICPIKEYKFYWTQHQVYRTFAYSTEEVLRFLLVICPVMNNLLLDIATCPTDLGND
jgi:hypothetical protein